MDCKSEAKSDPVGCGQYELGSNDGRPWGLLVRFIVRGLVAVDLPGVGLGADKLPGLADRFSVSQWRRSTRQPSGASARPRFSVCQYLAFLRTQLGAFQIFGRRGSGRGRWVWAGKSGLVSLGRIESANDDHPGSGEVGTCHPARVVGQGTGGPVFTFALGVSSWIERRGFAHHGPIHYYR